ncbi:nodulation protein NfeD [Rossellomorea vietnamensis]|uniref:Nodulation protein NfeD n=1 Tax=Rossellomorea vietnamensis TaxID=218284 RepID=A0A5D4KE93_9BACI|nr:nodulation protein NfeD [Rossellomorea vietnamensis]TYR75624.1 nodulation protein NfeD [Rossellomorea vietnamensis]
MLLLAVSLIGSMPFNTEAQGEGEIVFVIPIEKEVEKGLHAFLSRGIADAREAGADTIVFQIDTPGGLVDAAGNIAKLLDSTEIKTVAFVDNRALSAGAFIALHADEIYMVPNGTMGAAAVIDQAGNSADEKAQSYWLAAMRSAAETSGRDPKYALAMADKNVDLPEVGAAKGELLTLDARTAESVEYSEGTVSNMDELLKEIGLEDAEVISVEETFAEKLARFITNPVVVPILLSLASLGLVIELYSPGFGVAGSIGLASLLLFFYGHLVAGLAGYETLILFLIGAGLIVAEFFLPGGIAGILGIGAIIGSILMAGGDVVAMGTSLLIAMAVAIIAMVVFVKVFGKKMKLFNKIILKDSTSTEGGYVSNVNRLELIGATGVTKTALRPSGTIVIEDERIDAVSEGGFIGLNKPVRVVKVEGSRTVVREIE